MSVTSENEIICLRGDCKVEDAETLLTLLQTMPGSSVDLSAASQLHTAVFQILLAFRPRLTGDAGEPFLKNRLVPLLDADSTV